MNFLDKAKELAGQARGKAGEFVKKAGPSAVKGWDTAKSRLDKATGGKYHDKIENVSSKVGEALKRTRHPHGGGAPNNGSGSAGPRPDTPSTS